MRAILIVGLIVGGVALLIAGNRGFVLIESFGSPISSEIAGTVLIGFAVVLFIFTGGRRRRAGGDHDPESHHALPRDVRDAIDDAHDPTSAAGDGNSDNDGDGDRND